MSYQLEMRKEPAYLFVQVTGVRTMETIMAAAKEIVAACDENKYKKVLLDVRGMTGGISTFDAYDLGTLELEELRRPGRLKVSIVDLKDNQDRFRFLETVVHNRGFNLSIFFKTDEAIKWLCGSETSSS